MQTSRVENSLTEALPAESAWDEAFLRVESYLRAHHLEGRVLLNQVVADIIREARGQNSAEPPVTVAMRVMHARTGNWFVRAGHTGDWSDARIRQQGRLALVLGNVPERWGNYFLSGEPPPPELAAALASGVLQSGPELRFSNMPPAPLEFGFIEPDDLNSIKRSSWLIVREAAGWLSVVGLFGVAWAASH